MQHSEVSRRRSSGRKEAASLHSAGQRPWPARLSVSRAGRTHCFRSGIRSTTAPVVRGGRTSACVRPSLKIVVPIADPAPKSVEHRAFTRCPIPIKRPHRQPEPVGGLARRQVPGHLVHHVLLIPGARNRLLRSSPNHAESSRPAGAPAVEPGAPVTSPFSALQVRWEIHFFNSFMTLAHKCTAHTSLVDAIRRLFVACGWIATGRSTAHPTERDRTVELVRSVPSWLSGWILARAPSIVGRHERDLLMARRPAARVPTDDAG